MRKLTDAEKLEITTCIAENTCLPDKYRFLLFDNNRTCELVWAGKTANLQARKAPLCLNQRFAIAEKSALSDRRGTLGPKEGAWANKLIWGDNKLVLAALLQGKAREEIEAQGGLKLIYIDPPFCTESDFTMGPDSGKPAGARSHLNAVAYRDKWGSPADFLNMLYDRLRLMHELLAIDGSIYAHCDWRMNSCLRLMLDESFGNYVNEICWHYTGGGRSGKYFSRKHDSILIYSKSTRFIFNKDAIRIPYKATSSYAKSGIKARSGKRYLPNPAGAVPDDVWDIPIINPLAGERLGYPTQKPEALVERIIRASSQPGDLVADFFCGSGTFAAVAAKLGRKWLAVDSGRLAILTARKRLLAALPERAGLNSQPFELWSIPSPEAYSRMASPEREGLSAAGAYIGTRVHIEGHKVAIQLLDFRAGGSELEEKPAHVWSDWIDYWAVDFDYGAISGGETGGTVFNSCWQAWRKSPGLELELISPYLEVAPGLRKLAVEVVDIFGFSSLAVFDITTPE